MPAEKLKNVTTVKGEAHGCHFKFEQTTDSGAVCPAWQLAADISKDSPKRQVYVCECTLAAVGGLWPRPFLEKKTRAGP